MRELPPGVKIITYVKVHSASDLLKSMRLPGSADPVNVRIETGLKDKILRLLGPDVTMSQLVKNLLLAYAKHEQRAGDGAAADFLSILKEPEGTWLEGERIKRAIEAQKARRSKGGKQ